MKIQSLLMAFGLAGAVAIGAAVSVSAGPLPTGIATVKSAPGDHVTDVQWRGYGYRGFGYRGYGFRGYGPRIGIGIGAGILAGALIGSAVAAPYGYYGVPVYPGPYAMPYAYGPGYAAPGYYGGGYGGYGYGGYGYYGGGYGYGCYTNEGYGRRRPCDAQ